MGLLEFDDDLLESIRKDDPALLKLDFGEDEVGGDEMEELLSALETNTSVTAIDFKGSRFGNTGAFVLASLLLAQDAPNTLGESSSTVGSGSNRSSNSHLRILSVRLYDTALDDKVFVEEGDDQQFELVGLARAIQRNSILTELDLSLNEIGVRGARALAEALQRNSTLTSLVLHDNDLGPEGVTALTPALMMGPTATISTNQCSMTNLDLSRNDLGNEGVIALVEALKVNSKLKVLELSDNEIGDAGAVALAEALKVNSSVQVLALWDNEISDLGACTLAEAIEVESSVLMDLQLIQNEIGSDGGIALARAIAKKRSVSKIWLNENNLGDAGAAAFAEALKESDLTGLGLGTNGIGDSGAEALGKALKTNESLTHIDLAANEIEDDGFLALAEALKVNTTVKTLDLSRNKNVGRVGSVALHESLKVNTAVETVDLSCCGLIDDDGAETIAETLIKNTSMVDINLDSNSIGNRGAVAIAKALTLHNTTLRKLYIRSNLISNDGAVALIYALENNRSTLEMDLGFNDIDHDEIDKKNLDALVRVLETNLTICAIEGFEHPRFEPILRFNRELKQFKELQLTTLDLSDVGLQDVGRVRVNAIGQAIISSPHLVSLDLQSISLGAVSLSSLGDALKKSTSIKAINLRDCMIGADGMRMFLSAIDENESMTAFRLGGNDLGDDGCLVVADFIRRRKNLTEIDLSNNFIGDESIEKLLSALQANESLSVFDISHNILSDFLHGMIAIISTSTNIVKLNLEGLQYHDLEAEEYMKFYGTLVWIPLETTAIESIDLSEIELGASIDGLVNSVKQNERIREIRLRQSSIGSEEARLFADAKFGNLCALDLRENEFGDDGLRHIIRGMKENRTLTKLLIEDTDAAGDLVLQCNQFVKANRVRLRHEAKAAEVGLSFYLENGKWTQLAWECAEGDGRTFGILQGVLSEHCNKDDAFKVALKSVIEEDRRYLPTLNGMDKKKRKCTLLEVACGLESVEALEICRFFVEFIGIRFFGTRAFYIASNNTANTEMKEWANKAGTFLDRYRIEGSRGLDSDPVYRSATCTVYFALDTECFPGDDEYQVALKIMHNRDNFERELKSRLSVGIESLQKEDNCPGMDTFEVNKYNKFDGKYVIPIYRYHEIQNGNGDSTYCLVMSRGERTLVQMVNNESFAFKDMKKIRSYARQIACSVQHIHDKQQVHGDISPNNVVRDPIGNLKLIDFDESSRLGETLAPRFSSAYITPERAQGVFRPQESLEFLRVRREVKERDLKLASGHGEKVQSMLKELREIEAHIRFLKEEETRLSRDSGTANLSDDIWAFGLTMYFLYTGNSIFKISNDRRDRMIGTESQLRLREWNGLQETELLAILQHVSEDGAEDRKVTTEAKIAQDFFRKCMAAEPSKRFQSMSEVLKHPILLESRNARSDEMLQIFNEIPSAANPTTQMKNVAASLDEIRHKLIACNLLSREIMGNVEVAPLYLVLLPVETNEGSHRSLDYWSNPDEWLQKTVKFHFLCPITSVWCGRGDEFQLADDWGDKFGPSIMLGLTALKYLCAAGRLSGLPLSSINETMTHIEDPLVQRINFLTKMLHHVKRKLDKGGLTDVVVFIERSIDGHSQDSSSERVEPSHVMKNDMTPIQSIRKSYDQVRATSSDEIDNMVLAVYSKDESAETTKLGSFVKKDARIKRFYEKYGGDCFRFGAGELHEKLLSLSLGESVPIDDAENITAGSIEIPRATDHIELDDSTHDTSQMTPAQEKRDSPTAPAQRRSTAIVVHTPPVCCPVM